MRVKESRSRGVALPFGCLRAKAARFARMCSWWLRDDSSTGAWSDVSVERKPQRASVSGEREAEELDRCAWRFLDMILL